MTDAFTHFLNDVGEEVFGVQWVFMRPHVERWLQSNPERVAWLTKRLTAYASEVRA